MKVRTILTASLLLSMFAGCQTLQEVANLRNVNFDLDSVAGTQLAGVDVQNVRGYNDLRATDLMRLTAALTSGSLPLSFTVNVGAENPKENGVQARLVNMDWTLFLDERETVSGTFDQNLLIPAGARTSIPIGIRLDLVNFFDKNLPDLLDLALAISGEGGASKRVMLKVRPTIDTPIGPIRYPNAITVVSREVGGARQ